MSTSPGRRLPAPILISSRLDSFSQRFWSQVSIPGRSECWVWNGSKSNKGYGTIRYGGRRVGAHRYAYTWKNGPAGDLFVCHRCDNRSCVNPEHFFLGTNSDNMRDKVSKSRQGKGEGIGASKLTEDLVRQIRREYSGGGVTLRHLGEKHGVHFATVSHIITRKSWNHVQ